MSASKKSKTPAKSRAAKKPSGKKQTARVGAKNDAKRARKSPVMRDAVKSPRPHAKAASQPTRLAAAALAQEERKPAKKAEPRPNRPPAVLPIPQSTFFF